MLEVLNEVGRYLGMGIANLVNTFNPSLVVLGGGLSLASPYILPRAQQEVEVRTLAAVRQRLQITWSAFKFDSCAIGAVTLILREVLNNPTVWQPHATPATTLPERDNFHSFVQLERAI